MSRPSGLHLQRLAFRAMGSPCELRVYAAQGEGASAIAAGRAEVLRLEAKYSRYRDDSLATRLHRSAGDAAGVEDDAETAQLLDYADACFRQSGGLFDVTSGILRRAWNLKSGRLPEPGEIDALLPLVGWQRVRWRAPRLVLPQAGMQLDFGGYVKEYAADRVAGLCRARGVRHGLVDLGGDLAVIGPHPDGAPWRVGIRDPRDPAGSLGSLPLAWGAVATSGDYERAMVVNGVRYGHILDPRTGWPVRGLASATVVADACLVAGTLTTSALLRGRRRRRMARRPRRGVPARRRERAHRRQSGAPAHGRGSPRHTTCMLRFFGHFSLALHPLITFFSTLLT